MAAALPRVVGQPMRRLDARRCSAHHFALQGCVLLACSLGRPYSGALMDQEDFYEFLRDEQIVELNEQVPTLARAVFLAMP